jgi:hypothetical protein
MILAALPGAGVDDLRIAARPALIPAVIFNAGPGSRRLARGGSIRSGRFEAWFGGGSTPRTSSPFKMAGIAI